MKAGNFLDVMWSRFLWGPARSASGGETRHEDTTPYTIYVRCPRERGVLLSCSFEFSDRKHITCLAISICELAHSWKGEHLKTFFQSAMVRWHHKEVPYA